MQVFGGHASHQNTSVQPTTAGACLIALDVRGFVRRWSEDAELMFGYARERCAGLRAEHLAPFLNDRSGALEGWCKRADGSVFRGLVSALSASDHPDLAASGGEHLRLLVFTDITSRYVREQAEIRVRERIDAVTTSVAQLAFFSIDPAQDVVEIWGAFADVFGAARATPPCSLRELLQLVHVDDREAVRSSLERALGSAAPFEVELRVRGDLGERWMLMAGSPVEGPLPRVVGAAMNVSRRRALDQALWSSESKLDAVLDATLDGIMMIDAKGMIEALNRSACNFFRSPDNSLIGTPWQSVLDVGGDALPACGTLREAIGRRADGSCFSMECSFSELGSGAERMQIVVMRDVTQRRLLERQVLDVSEQLQRQIGQDLHDGLGQLLTGTAFLTKGLQHSLGTEHQPQAQRIVELINLAIARVRNLARGLSPIHVESQSLEAVLRHTISEASELLGVACELSLHDFLDSAQPQTIAQLCLIAREAITNAVRHGRAQRIIVRLSHQEDGSVLSVEDGGVGIGDVDKPLEGLGLRSMRYRAKVIGGRLDIVRTRRGTTIRCSWRDV
jgi:signal transduction histidine kinase